MCVCVNICIYTYMCICYTCTHTCIHALDCHCGQVGILFVMSRSWSSTVIKWICSTSIWVQAIGISAVGIQFFHRKEAYVFEWVLNSHIQDLTYRIWKRFCHQQGLPTTVKISFDLREDLCRTSLLLSLLFCDCPWGFDFGYCVLHGSGDFWLCVPSSSPSTPIPHWPSFQP